MVGLNRGFMGPLLPVLGTETHVPNKKSINEETEQLLLHFLIIDISDTIGIKRLLFHSAAPQ
jgi:hypothetical protein